MPLKKIELAPGINRENTRYATEGGWYEGDKIRFRQGTPEKIGGWERISTTTFLGVCRSLWNWVTIGGQNLVGVGTNLKFYIERGGFYYDVTPIRATTAAGDVTFAAVNGSSTLTVADTAHGAAQNDFVTFSGAVSLGGNITAAVLNQEYQVLLVVDENSYTITAKDTAGATVTANASDTGNGGGVVVGEYQISHSDYGVRLILVRIWCLLTEVGLFFTGMRAQELQYVAKLLILQITPPPVMSLQPLTIRLFQI